MVFNHYYGNITFIVEWRHGATNRAMQCLHQKSIKVSISPPTAPCGCHQGRMKARGKYTCPGYSPNLQPFVSQRSLRLGDAAVFLTTGYIFVFSSIPIPTPISISAIFPWHHYRREGVKSQRFSLTPSSLGLAFPILSISVSLGYLCIRERWSEPL